MRSDELRKKIADLIDEAIANLGYPVGMGMPPSRIMTDRLAQRIALLMKD